jgi:uncharacterized protein
MMAGIMESTEQVKRSDPAPILFDCQSCGACCDCDASWPRFTLEEDAEISLIPPALICSSGSGMACEGTRCLALAGKVGLWTACAIHPARPHVCRDCMPGDPECLIARARHGLPALTPA